MTSNPTTVGWKGASGTSYTYFVYSIGWLPDDGQDGNYIFAKVVGNRWQAVYVGEGELRNRILSHVKTGCVTRKGATHIHAHLNSRAGTRKTEESDILSANPAAYEPTGCNKR